MQAPKMLVKSVIAVFAVVCLGAAAVHGLQCYDYRNKKIVCNADNANSLVYSMGVAGYNTSAAYPTYKAYACITINQTIGKPTRFYIEKYIKCKPISVNAFSTHILSTKGCTYSNFTCNAPLKRGYTITESKCRSCMRDLCNGVGVNVMNMSAVILALISGVLGKKLFN